MMGRVRLLFFLVIAVLISAAAIIAGRPGGSTVIRVVDPSGAPYADAVVLVNPRWDYESIALVTDRNGMATLPRLKCKVCVVTAIDPRRMFYDKTTEFERGTRSVTLVLSIRPVAQAVDSTSMKVTAQINGPDGRPLANREVLVRNKTETIKDDWFSMLRTDSKGKLKMRLDPGKYVVAFKAKGKFLEGLLNVNPEVRRYCSAREAECLQAVHGKEARPNVCLGHAGSEP